MSVYNETVVRTSIVGAYDGQQVINVLHWALSGAGETWDIDQVRTVTETVRDWAEAFLCPILSGSYSLFYVRGVRMSGPGAFAFQAGSSASGGRAGEGMPGNTAVCVSHNTGRSGRGYSGRTYLSAIPADAVNLNRVTDAYRTDIEAAFLALTTTEPFSGYVPVVYSTQVDGGPRLAGLATPIISFTLRDNVVDSQRRRLPGRGR